MTTNTTAEYHGQEYVEGQEAIEAPPNPKEMVLADEAIERGTGTYAQVTMIGNYGPFCAQPQTLRFSNISLAQAKKLKWDYFGLCGAVMTCFDLQGNVVHEE